MIGMPIFFHSIMFFLTAIETKLYAIILLQTILNSILPTPTFKDWLPVGQRLSDLKSHPLVINKLVCTPAEIGSKQSFI